MNNEEKFKKTLQDKIESKEFAFDETEWEKAAAILDASKKGGNRGAFYFLSGALLLLLSIVSFTIFSDTKTRSFSKQTEQQVHQASENKLLAEKTTNTINSARHESVLDQGTKSETTSKKLTQAKSSENSKDQILITKVATDSEIKTENNEDSPITINKQNNGNLISQEENSSSDDLNSTKHNSNSMASETDKALSPLPEVLAATPLTEDQKNEAKQIESLGIAVNESNNVTVTDTSTKNTSLIAKENASTISNSDTSAKSLQAPTQKLSHNILNFELGATYLFGWKNPDGRDANGLNVLVGLNYLSNVAEKYWFSLGIYYTTTRNLSYSSKTSTVTRYKLGEESDVTTITPSTLHYLSFPFKLQYQLNDKNAFGLGYTANYLVNVESKVETYTEKLHSTENHETYTTGGYTEGFKLLSSQIGIFYRRNLIKDLHLNVDFIFGLTDIKENSFFQSDSFERNSGIKVTLTYNLFNH